MTSLIDTLAPQMAAYRKQFHTDGDVEWVPYLMFFHPKNYSSAVVNTDSLGFRFSEHDGSRYSVATGSGLESARLVAGNSVVFGIGASSDANTLASRMMAHDPRPQPWINFGGRAFNSAQELMLITLYRHVLPPIDEIVLFSGANNLFLARLHETYIQEHGAFYNCGLFFDTFQADSPDRGLPRFSFSGLFGTPAKHPGPADNAKTLEERIEFAAALTLRHLDGWNAVARDLGAKLTYVLQPISGWVRDQGCKEEQALFRELASLPRYTTVDKVVLQSRVGERYASLLEAGMYGKEISFVNMNAVLRAATRCDQWLFIDHTHLTDEAYDTVARMVVDNTC